MLGGIYALVSSSSVIELGAMLPRAGGWYVFARRSFGEYGGFVTGCLDWTMQSVAMAYLAVAFGEFAAGFQPRLEGSIKMLALGVVSVLAFLNWIGLRSGSRLTSLVKTAGLLVFVFACFLPPAATGKLSPLSSHPNTSFFVALVVAPQAVIVTYDGWYSPIYFAEEDTDPGRHLPRSMIGSVVACIVIYLLVSAVLFRTLPLSQLAGSAIPAADAALAVFGAPGRQFILIISMVTVVSTINATLLITPRILYAMSRDGLLPRWATSVNAGGTPGVALFLSTAATIALILSGGFETLIAIASVLYVLVYMSGFVALLVLRRSEPSLPRPDNVWWYPWSTVLLLIGSMAFFIGAVVGDLKNSLYGLILLVCTYPLYALVVRNRTRRAGLKVAELHDPAI